MVSEIDKIFDSFEDKSLFKDKRVLQSDYTPENIPHREEQIKAVASLLAPLLRGERCSNLFVYGKTGTGKTLSVQHVCNAIKQRVDLQGNPHKLRFEYINCKLKMVADTEYRILAELIKKLGEEVPATGLPTNQVYGKFVELIEEQKPLVVIILDEIDQAVKKISSDFLYNLTRLNTELKGGQISIIGISNDFNFLDNIDARVKSSLSEEEMVFPSYNALQLQDILKERASKAFKPDVFEEGVVQKCAAFAAMTDGDARRALDLLRIAGELCERERKQKIGLEHIDKAKNSIERDKILDLVETGPKQFKLVLLSIIELVHVKGMKKVFTGDVYNFYDELCLKTKTERLTQRRVSDIIQEFDMLGLINATVVSKGRQGRTKEIRLRIPGSVLKKVMDILYDQLNL